MNSLESQSRVQLPGWSKPLFEPHPYKTAIGGRGSAKSWSFARALLITGTTESLRVGCFRETQRSIRDSVHRLLCDQIADLNMGAYWDAFDHEIRGKSSQNGESLFVFAGLQDHTVDSIKSFEGLDRAWVEEGQRVKARSRKVLLPTIRKPGSEVWVTMNPELETDDSYQFWVSNPPPGAVLMRANWRDNPWFDAKQNDLRLHDQKHDPDYENIWEGQPGRVAPGAIYRREVERLYEEGRVRNVPYDPILRVHTVWDLGWNDSMCVAFVQRSGSEVRVIDYIEDSHQTLDWYVAEIEKRPYRWGQDFIPHDGRAKDFRSGKSTEDVLLAMGRRPVVLAQASVEEGIKAARLVFPRAYFDATKAARLVECLKRYRRAINTKTNEPGGPLHDEFSHGADCWRYVGQALDLMRNDASGKLMSPATGIV